MTSVLGLLLWRPDSESTRKLFSYCVRQLMITESGSVNMTTELHEAIRHGDLDQVKLLLDKGADVNSVDKNGLIPVVLAARLGQASCISILLEAHTKIHLMEHSIKQHDYPGKLIVLEGLDGSGKSSQLQMLKEALEKMKLHVTLLTWNGSPLVTEKLKALKKVKKMTALSAVAFCAASLGEQMERVIVPSLKEGGIILFDRYFFTSLARDVVRGMDPQLLRNLHNSIAIAPDLTIFVNVPVSETVGRVLTRREERLKLSEDGDPDNITPASVVKYYEGGLDLNLKDNPVDNFKEFQSLCLNEYLRMEEEYGFKLLDGNRRRKVVHKEVMEIVSQLLSHAKGLKTRMTDLSNCFDRDPCLDNLTIRQSTCCSSSGDHRFFRTQMISMRHRFVALANHTQAPQVLLHGNPHVANIQKTVRGISCADFDRARNGPYMWDIVRFVTSLSHWQAALSTQELLSEAVTDSFKSGYIKGIRHPEESYVETKLLDQDVSSTENNSMREYIDNNKKWAGDMRKNLLPVDEPVVLHLFNDFVTNSGNLYLKNDYTITEIGKAFSALSGAKDVHARERYLIVLEPNNEKVKEPILLDIKRVRVDPNVIGFTNIFSSEIERVFSASQLYAPGFQVIEGGCSDKQGNEFYVLAIPAFSAKIKRKLVEEELKDLAYAVGTQLGRGHSLWLKSVGESALVLESHFLSHYKDIIAVSFKIKQEMGVAYRRYVQKAKLL